MTLGSVSVQKAMHSSGLPPMNMIETRTASFCIAHKTENRVAKHVGPAGAAARVFKAKKT